MTETKMLDIITEDGRAINFTHLMKVPLEEMATEDVHVAWSAIDIIEKAIKDRKDAMRDRLLADAKEHGEPTDKGHFELEVTMGKVTAQKSIKKGKANQEQVRELLMGKKIPVNSVLVRKTVVEFDTKAFEALVKDGQLTQAEADAIFATAQEIWSLKVEKPGFLKKAIESGQ